MSTKSKWKCGEKGEKERTKKNAKKRGKEELNISTTSVEAEIKAKLIFTSSEILHEKVQERISRIHFLTLCISEEAAEQRGLKNLQFVSLTTEKEALPALLIVDKKINDVAVIRDETSECLCDGEEVALTSQCSKLFAEEMTLCLLNNGELSNSVSFLAYLKEQLITHCVLLKIGMILMINYLSQDFVLKVKSIKNFALNEVNVPTQCIWQTGVSIESQTEDTLDSRKEKISFENLGGHKEALNTLLQELNSFFSKGSHERRTAKGILLSGASGCGKSLIGEAMKNKFGKSFLSIHTEDLKSKFIGETEQQLKKYFTKAAKRAPCILFIDDLDILCSSRDKGSTAGIVTALLHLMDGATQSSSEGVLVFATTSDPKSLDAALRRPGRLSLDILLQPPHEEDRKDIFEKLLYKVPNNLTDEDLQDLAVATPGYVGGDLRRVVMEAMLQGEGEPLGSKQMKAALASVKPAALKSSHTAEREIKLSDILGYDQLKHHLQESVNLTLRNGDIFLECGIVPPSRFFIFGPPGCGKTSLVMAIAAQFHLNVIPVKRSTVFGKYFGESEQNLTKIFAKAQESSPCIILFENFDGIAGTKGGDDGLDVGSRIINHLKVQLDGIVRNDGVFIFAETNRPDLVNKDVIRPGRFHEYHLIDLPGSDDRKAIISKNGAVQKWEGINLDEVVSHTKGFTVAEILQLCRELRLQNEEVTEFQEQSRDIISRGQVEDALQAVVPNTSQRMKNRYQSFAQTYCCTRNKDVFR